VLIGHSYGGMVATGVADRARERVVQLIYLDAFVPDDGQALIDFLPQQRRQRLLDSVNAGDGWRVAPNPIPADTSEQDSAWIAKFRMPQSVKCFQQPIHLQAQVTLPRIYIQCMRYADQGPFGQFAAKARRDGWPLYELDASHSPNVTAPDALAELLQKILLR
jgi:pimeloyl-ACP methyl ester carboxylesterase